MLAEVLAELTQRYKIYDSIFKIPLIIPLYVKFVHSSKGCLEDIEISVETATVTIELDLTQKQVRK